MTAAEFAAFAAGALVAALVFLHVVAWRLRRWQATS